MSQTLEEMARTVFQDWFVNFGPVRTKVEGQEPYLPPELWSLFPERLVGTELGEVPEGWKVGSFSDIVTELQGKENKENKVLGDETLRAIAQKLAQTIRNNITIDWTLRENAKANIRRLTRRILRNHRYPPDREGDAYCP